MPIYRLTALEPLRYRLMSSFPPEGYFLDEGKSMRITGEALKLASFRKEHGKGKPKYNVQLESKMADALPEMQHE